MSTNSDRNLAAAMIALDHEFIQRDQLVDVLTEWFPVSRDVDVEAIMEQRGLINATTRATLSSLVDNHFRAGCSMRRVEIVPDVTGGGARNSSLATKTFAIDMPSVPSNKASKVTFNKRFMILRPYARGGLGEVFVAQDQELDREVAVKQIRSPSSRDPESQARFLREARLTGRLQHPGIVPVYGLGYDSDDRPFYAMKLVDGESLKTAINAYHKNLSAMPRSSNPSGELSIQLRRLVRRLIDVCLAVDYAHNRGVLHRDLKPSNIVLGKYGETVVVDWGLAKDSTAADQNTQDRSLQKPVNADPSMTEEGQALGTPAFMSPEQAAGRIEVGPATDVYGLGATLFCILTGRAPFCDGDRSSLLENVQNGDFARPRSIVASVPEALEAICVKAMATRADARYPSCRELANDLERWLAYEPVSAYPEPFSARFWRWANRHRVGLVSTGVATVVGSIVLAVALGVVSNQRTELANANGMLNEYANELEFAKNESESKRVRAESAVEFLVNALSSPRPDRKGREVTVVEVLDTAFDQIDAYFKDDWVGRILVAQAFADTYEGLGLYSERVEAQKKCYDTLLREQGKFHEDTVAALGNLAAAYSEAGMSDQAMPLLEEAVQVLRQTQGANDADTLSAINNLAVEYSNNGRDQEAIPYLQEVLDIRTEILGPKHRDTLETLNNLASSYSNIGQLEKALEAYEQALNICKAEFSDDDQLHLGLINNLGMAYIRAHRTEEARALFDRALESYRARFKEEHPFTLICMNNLGLALISLERTDEAVPLFEKTLAGKKSLLPPDHPSTVNSMSNLANAYDYVKRYEEAEDLHQRSITITKRASSSGQITQQAAIFMGMLARNQLLQGKYEKAEEMCRKALPPLVETAPNDWRSFEAKSILGAALVGQGEFAEAERLLIDGYEGLAETRSSIPPFAKQRPLEAIKRLIELYESWGKPGETATWKAKLDKEAFASFWTNTIWKWIDRRIPFWRSDWLRFAR